VNFVDSYKNYVLVMFENKVGRMLNLRKDLVWLQQLYLKVMKIVTR